MTLNVGTATKVQLVADELPAGELEFAVHAVQDDSEVRPVAVPYLPAPQFVQSADPVDVLYLPATHAVHVPPSGPE